MRWTDETYEGKKLYIGKYNVAGVVRTCDRSPNRKYRTYCLLPGIKEFLGYFEEIKPATEKIDGAVGIWLMNTRLIEKGVE